MSADHTLTESATRNDVVHPVPLSTRGFVPFAAAMPQDTAATPETAAAAASLLLAQNPLASLQAPMQFAGAGLMPQSIPLELQLQNPITQGIPPVPQPGLVSAMAAQMSNPVMPAIPMSLMTAVVPTANHGNLFGLFIPTGHDPNFMLQQLQNNGAQPSARPSASVRG